VLELKVPQNILKTPKAMEQVFSAAYLEGQKHKFKRFHMAFEMAGRAGESRFYLRLPAQFRNMMEAAVYAQYPDAEITEVDDYVKQMPKVLPNQDFDLHGLEETLAADSYYPIATYLNFEDSVEERRLDPISFLMEAMAKLKESEQLWFQLVVKSPSPAEAAAWKKKGESGINKLLGVEEKKPAGFWAGFGPGVGLRDILLSPIQHPNEAVPPKKEEKEKPNQKGQHPVIKEAVEGIRQKVSKLAFETTVRALYLDRRESFAQDNVNAIGAFFRLFNTQHLNSFKPEAARTTGKPKGLFKKWKLALRKREFYGAYTGARPTGGAKCMLNVEELATLYHFPIGTVGTTELQKVASRKSGPPASLPMVE
jgi:hypothetical protein